MECRLCISVQKNGVCPIYNIFGNCIMNPQITVIIPAYRRKNYLFFALDRILAQKDVTLEILVFSEVMGPDEVDEVTTAYPQVKYFKTDKYRGASEKRKAGISRAQGEFLYMPDDDDYLTDDYFFKKSISILNEDSDLAFVSGNLIIRHEKNGELIKEEKYIVNIQGKKKGLDYLQNLQIKYKKPYSTVSTIFRKRVFQDRNYKEMYEVSDVCMYMNALLWGDAFILNKIVAVYRFHDNNLTFSLPREFMMHVIKEKERVYLDSIGLLDDSKAFWYEHYRKTYLFYRDGKPSRKNKLSFLFWGLFHSHASKKVVSFCMKEMLKVFIISNE